MSKKHRNFKSTFGFRQWNSNHTLKSESKMTQIKKKLKKNFKSSVNQWSLLSNAKEAVFKSQW